MHLTLGLRTPAHGPEGTAYIRLNLPAEKNYETLLKYRQQLFKYSGDQPRQVAFKKAEFCRGGKHNKMSLPYTTTFSLGAFADFPQGIKANQKAVALDRNLQSY